MGELHTYRLTFEDKAPLRLLWTRPSKSQYEDTLCFSMQEVDDQVRTWGSQHGRPLSSHSQEDEIIVIAAKGFRHQRPFSIALDEFEELSAREWIHPTFSECLLKNNGSLACFTDVKVDEDGQPHSYLSAIIRTPFSPYMGFTCNIRYDFDMRRTICIFFGQTDKDIDAFLTYIQQRLLTRNSNQSARANPAMFASQESSFLGVLLVLIKMYSADVEEGRVELDRKLVTIERGTGMTWLPANLDHETVDNRFESLIRDMHGCNTNLIFLDSVIGFEVDLLEFSERICKTFQSMVQNFGNGAALALSPVHTMWKHDPILDYLSYLIMDTKTRQRQTKSLKERILCQMDLVYSLISQRDTRASVTVAESSLQDSRTMKTIALLTLIFLPGTLIMSIFSTDLFNLRAGDDNPDSFVARYWWILVVVAIVFTVAVLGTWILWSWNKKRRNKDKNSWLKNGSEKFKI